MSKDSLWATMRERGSRPHLPPVTSETRPLPTEELESMLADLRSDLNALLDRVNRVESMMLKLGDVLESWK